jgi:hypothetical protein
MSDKLFNAIKFGVRVLMGTATAYYVMKATDKKTGELVDNGGLANAAAVGAGQGALAASAGFLAYWLVP